MPAKGRRSRALNPLPPDTASLQTVGDWLRFCVTAFSRSGLCFAQGLHGPQEEAVFLVGRFLSLEQEDLPQFLSARLTGVEIRELKRLVRRRIEERVPVAYLVNEAWQGGCRFFVDERVLIPRSYIAELLPEAVQTFAGSSWNPRRILDVGTGSGALAVLAARAFPGASVDAADVSSAALEVAAENVAAHSLADRVHLIESDVFDGIVFDRYDLIVANPPYEPGDVIEALPPELCHEPRAALSGGADGMACVRRIVRESRHHLGPRGILVVEVGELRPQIEKEFPDTRPRCFALADGSDAVLGFRAVNLPKS